MLASHGMRTVVLLAAVALSACSDSEHRSMYSLPLTRFPPTPRRLPGRPLWT